MHSIQFWKHWQKPYQLFLGFLSAGFLLALILFWRGYFLYPAPTIGYDHYQQLESIEAPSHTFSVGLFNLTVPADSYLIFENIFGSSLQPNIFASYFFLATLAVSFIIFISIVPDLGRYRFLIAMAIVILFLASLQVDSLEILGVQNQAITLAIILPYGLLAFYFHALRTDIRFFGRFLIFSVLTAMVGLGISFFSKTTMPLLHLSATGLLAGIVICLIFILMVAHEIVAVFVSVITKSLKSEKSLQHFLILTTIYLVNVFLIFASKMGIIEWSFFSVSPFFLMAASAVLGIWGFRQRQPQHENILDDEPLRIYFFISLALVCVGVSTFFVSTASDMMIDALEDYIIACHFGVGLIFMLYIIANFAPMLKKNLPVYKILYKPETMPMFTFRIMAVIATFAVLSWAVSWKTYLNQMTATYYHAHGDLYLAKNDVRTAETFYLRSLRFRNQNLHAHYALASIYADRFESIKERREYEKAILWTPSIPMYLNLAYSYSSSGDLVESALTLDDAKKKFPKSGEVLNALGLSFLKLKSADSALHYFRRAQQIGETKETAGANVFAAGAWFNANDAIDSTLSIEANDQNGLVANQFALANRRHQQLAVQGKFSLDTSLNVYRAMTMSNYLINQKEVVDTALIRTVISLSHKQVNESFAEQMLIASAHALYAQGLVKEAVQIVREVAYNGGSPNCFSLLGFWLLEQRSPVAASFYFKTAGEKSVALAFFHEALAETETDNIEAALAKWDTLRKSNDKNIRPVVERMMKVLRAKPDWLDELIDEEKYLFCRYRIPLNDKKLFEKTIAMMADGPLRAEALIDRSRKLFSMDEAPEATLLLNQLQTSYSRNINQQVANLRLMIAADKGDWQFVQENLASTELSVDQRIYFEALLAAQSGNQKAASQKFNYLAKANSYFEEGVVASSRFFANDTSRQMKNLSLLVDGLLAKPRSVKILKEHAVLAAELGFTEAAQDSLDKLQAILPKESFERFVGSHKDYFGTN